MLYKRKSFGSALKFIKGHPSVWKRYLSDFYNIEDWPYIKHFFKENPIQARIILEDFNKSNDSKIREVARLFVAGKSKIVYIVGARDSGKTATAFKFAETVHYEIQRHIYYIAPDANRHALPDWCKVVDNIQNAPRGCLGLIDEAALQYNAREFMKKENVNMTKILAIARHKDIFLIFLTQDTALADTNIRRLRDIVIWKMSNDYSLTERGNRNTREHKFYQKVRNMMAPREKDQCLFEFPSKRRFIHFKHNLPECWSDELSKMWKETKFGPKEDKTLKITQKREVIYI